MPDTFKLREPIATSGRDLTVGDPGQRRADLLYLGKLAEVGPVHDVWLDVSGEQVIAAVGRRGSGKSYTLGSLLEGLCTSAHPSALSRISTPRAVLLLDTLDIFWPSKNVVNENGPPRVRAQYDQLKHWGLSPEPLHVEVWIPAGFRGPADPPTFRDFSMDVSDFRAFDWASLFGFDLFNEPRGQLIGEVFRKVTQDGWAEGPVNHPAKADYAIPDLIACLGGDPQLRADYAQETIRAVRQRLQAVSNLPLMAGAGTPLTELLVSGSLSVLLTARLDPDLRGVLVSVLLRKIMDSRVTGSFAKKRLATEGSLSADERNRLELTLQEEVPRTWVAIDEAQNVIPSDSRTTAHDTVIRFVKEGRNIGLSLALTTQQPGSIDNRVMSQVMTFIVHQLATQKDYLGVEANLKSDPPTHMSVGGSEISLRDLIRRLAPGQAVVSASPTSEVGRCIVVNVRPRVAVHGGFED